MQTTRVAIADDHKLFRHGIGMLISGFGHYEVIFGADDGQDLIRKMDELGDPDIVIVDLNMPRMNGQQSVLWLNQHKPKIRIIVLTMIDDMQKAAELLRLGVKGYLLKDAEPEDFRQALDRVRNGNYWFPPDVKDMFFESAAIKSHVPGSVRLSAREHEFLRLCVSDLSYREIAGQMGLSIRTLDGYRDQLSCKLGVKGRPGLMIYSLKNNLTDLDNC
ncbi:MAG: response regulator transcription factor [Mucilaginibacter polytrichastri]|nr:response regulator transcription factor [Mucilaginibacter polytrichastri]